jgi:hypothetical protein
MKVRCALIDVAGNHCGTDTVLLQHRKNKNGRFHLRQLGSTVADSMPNPCAQRRCLFWLRLYDNLAARTDLLKRGFIAPFSGDPASFFSLSFGGITESSSERQIHRLSRPRPRCCFCFVVAEHDCTACLGRRTTSSSNATRRRYKVHILRTPTYDSVFNCIA